MAAALENPTVGAQLWRVLRRLFDPRDADQSLRARIEEAIDEHEDDAAQ